VATIEEQIGSLEAAASRGKLGWLKLFITLKSWEQRELDIDFLLERLYAVGYNDSRFLRYAFERFRDQRNFESAQRYSETWSYNDSSDVEARFWHSWVTGVLGDFRIAASFSSEQLDAHPGDLRTKSLLSGHYLRLGQHRDALTMLRESGRSSELETWLEQIVEKGKRPQKQHWMGRKARPPRRLAQMEWKRKVLRAPMKVSTRNWNEIDAFINSCRYESDERLYGEADTWIPPAQFEEVQQGDCEDFALWTWVQLLRQGVNARFVTGAYADWKLNHAWVQIYQSSHVSVVECTPGGFNVPIGAAFAHEYVPMISVDRTLTWYDH
jgi:predicted transglutaminase-like cysteine proteinase